jgi:N-methylhydantoinase B
VSVEAARREYGVVLTGDLWALTLAIDHAATDALRAEMRSARA